MAKKIILEVTKAQLNAIVAVADELDASMGAAEDDSERLKWVRLIDRMLLKNGFTR